MMARPDSDTPREATPPAEAPAIELDAAPPAADAAPPLPALAPHPESARRRRRLFSASILAGLVLSAAVHAAVIAYLGERAPEGLEAAMDAVSVEIVLEAPPDSPPAIPVAGAEVEAMAEPEDAASRGAPEAAEELVETAATFPPSPTEAAEPKEEAPPVAKDAAEGTAGTLPPQPDETAAPTPKEDGRPPVEATEPPDATMPPLTAETAAEPFPAAETEESAQIDEAKPLTAEADEAETAEVTPAETAAAEGEDAPETAAGLTLSTENIPIPTPRPARPRAAAPVAQAAQAQPPGPRREQTRPPETARERQPAPAAGQPGGATAGETAAYSRRLLAHVERHKRDPPEAARRGIAGAAALSITIDHQGRLTAARLAGGSGHAILDEEALAVARRAAPYPPPPEGVGGQTITFSVTLRFRR